MDLITVWSDSAEVFDGELMRLASTLSSDLTYALDNLVIQEKAEVSAVALSESRRLLTAVTRDLPLLVVVFDLPSRALCYANDRAGDLLGYSASELIALGEGLLPAVIHEPDLPAVERELARAAALPDGSVAEVTARAKAKGRGLRWMSARMRVFERDPEGRASRLLCVVEDIDLRMNLLAELRRVAGAVENAAESIVITDAAGVIQYVNPAFERVTGYSAAEAIGRHTRVLKSGQHDDALYKRLWTTIASGEVWRGRMVNKRKDGSLFEEDVSIAPIKGEQGGIANFVAVKRDVSQERSLEDQLRQAQKLEAVGRLAGGVAHDFNNILTSILGFTQMALESLAEDSTLHGDLKEVEKGARRAAELTRQLLIFSRRQLFRPRLLDPERVVANLQKMLRRIVGETYPLRFHSETKGSLIMADPSQLEQVVMNFVVNSRDAMPAGGEIDIGLREERLSSPVACIDGSVPPGEYVLLSVRDSGTGIPADVLPHIFEPFFTTKPPESGTGLGLSTVYGIVKQSGACLVVDSSPGRGTTMTVYWPSAGRPMEEAEGAVETPAPGGKGESILLVEDEPAVRALTERILTRAGYRVSAHPDARSALADAAGDSYDLVLTDVVLPGGMSGVALSEALRRARPSQMVILMSGHAEEVHANSTRLKEGGRFLQKPFSREELLVAIREALDPP